MRDTRFLLTIVRAVLRRMRFFACGVLAISSSKIQSVQRSEHSRKRSSRIARGRRTNVRIRPVPDDRTLLEGCAHSHAGRAGQWFSGGLLACNTIYRRCAAAILVSREGVKQTAAHDRPLLTRKSIEWGKRGGV